MIRTRSILGWDIGGVNTKAALVADGVLGEVTTRPFELQRAPDRLPDVLAEIAGALRAVNPVHAVTMTAELSQMFRTKREGVRFVIDAVERAFPAAPIHVYTTDGRFVSTTEAREQPLRVAAANWMATATLMALHHRDALLVDIGTTTTDIIPVVGGRVRATGRTDLDRLAAGELVYSGAVRTPLEAIVREVPVSGTMTRVSAEGFALTGDVHVWLGALMPAAYDAATPDGRPSSREFAGERLARLVCADREKLDDDAITQLAQAAANQQVTSIAAAIRVVLARHPSITAAVVTGLGAFIGTAAVRAAGLDARPWSAEVGDAAARSAPAAAVALLLSEQQRPLTVLKLGGSLLSNPDRWRAVTAAIASSSTARRLVVVPGGGPFADQVRDLDRRVGLSGTTAHWMAIGGMDQHADLIAGTDPRFVRVTDRAAIAAAHADARVPVVAPLEWLRAVDPLPHSWDVTSDSIAAWMAGELDADRLVLIKSAGVQDASIVDPYFDRALPRGLDWTTCPWSEIEAVLQGDEPVRP